MADKYTADRKGVQKWLIDHPRIKGRSTTMQDAYSATGYSGPALKPAEGNLTTNRENLRLKVRGQNGAQSRKQNKTVSTPPSANTKRADLKVKHINAKGLQGDHINPLARTGNAIRALMKSGQFKEALRLVQRFGNQIGHQPENIQALSAKENGQKEKDYRSLDRKFRQMEIKSQSPTLKQMGVKQPKPKPARRGSLRVPRGGREQIENFNYGLDPREARQVSDGLNTWLLP